MLLGMLTHTNHFAARNMLLETEAEVILPQNTLFHIILIRYIWFLVLTEAVFLKLIKTNKYTHIRKLPAPINEPPLLLPITGSFKY